MSVLKPRQVFKWSPTSNREVHELLQAALVAEFLAPSRRFWLVCPWATDIGLIDNRTGAFDTFEPSWGRREILLTEILLAYMHAGTKVVVVIRPETHNESFVRRLREQAADANLNESLTVNERELLHIKGILTDHYYLSGSMNFTYNGVKILEEEVRFETDPERVANSSLEFERHYLT